METKLNRLGLTPTELQTYFGAYLMRLFYNWVGGDGTVFKDKVFLVPGNIIDQFMGTTFPRGGIGYDQKPQ